MEENKEPLYYIKLGSLYIEYIYTSSECVNSNFINKIEFNSESEDSEKYTKQDAEKLIKIMANVLSIEENYFEIEEVEEEKE